jgi:ribosomal protein S18 acetylase RimI-like enzyme
MILTRASDDDLPEVAALVNAAYRGDGATEGWTTEAAYIAGQRTDVGALRRDLSAQPAALLLVWREAAAGPIVACVWLEPAGEGIWYLGMLTVRPDLQDRRLGRTLLRTAEAHAASLGAVRVQMTVVNVRDTLIAWYERRGYRLTGEQRPFPYDAPQFGTPLRPDLAFVVLEKELEGEDGAPEPR